MTYAFTSRPADPSGSARATGRTISTTARRCSTSPTRWPTTRRWRRSPTAGRARTASRGGPSTPTRRSRRCQSRRVPRRLHARAARSDVSHLRYDHRRHGPTVGGRDRHELADAARASTSTPNASGSGFDEQTLDDIGEQVSLRQFDISDRNSDRFSAIVQVMPRLVAVVQRVRVGRAAKNGRARCSACAATTTTPTRSAWTTCPRDAVSLGLSYEYEKYTRSRRRARRTRASSSTIRRATGRPTAATGRTRSRRQSIC